MTIQYNKAKNFDLTKGSMPKVLFFGNGFFYEDKSWDEFINENAGSVYKTIEEEIKWHIPNTIKASIATSENDRERWAGYSKAVEGTDYNLNIALLKKLLEIKFDTIITSNYTWQIENALDHNFVKTKNKIDKYVCRSLSPQAKVDAKYLLHTFNRIEKDGKQYDVWHTHGEQRVPSSMILTHDEYGKLFSKIADYNKNEIGKRYTNSEDVRFFSWIDYLLLADVYILGFGCGFEEFDFWWLLNRRKREHSAKGKIICYMPDKPDNLPKIKALEMTGVVCRSLEFSKKGMSYSNFYEAAVSDIAKSI